MKIKSSFLLNLGKRVDLSTSASREVRGRARVAIGTLHPVGGATLRACHTLGGGQGGGAAILPLEWRPPWRIMQGADRLSTCVKICIYLHLELDGARHGERGSLIYIILAKLGNTSFWRARERFYFLVSLIVAGEARRHRQGQRHRSRRTHDSSITLTATAPRPTRSRTCACAHTPCICTVGLTRAARLSLSGHLTLRALLRLSRSASPYLRLAKAF